MSANNQTLVKRHEGKYLVFSNINAESWDEVNVLDKEHATEYENLIDALECAREIEMEDPTEYGIQFDKLIKDQSDVIIK